jgi:hypothetical protein
MYVPIRSTGKLKRLDQKGQGRLLEVVMWEESLKTKCMLARLRKGKRKPRRMKS